MSRIHVTVCKPNIDESKEPTIEAKPVVIRELRPVIILLRIFGLYYERKESTADQPSSTRVHTFTKSEIYSALIVLIHWLNLCRMFNIIEVADGFGNVLFGKILILTWLTLCSVNATAMFIACRKCMPEFFKLYNQVCNFGNTEVLIERRCHMVIILTVFATIVWVANVILGFVSIFEFHFVTVLTPFPTDGTTGIILKAVYFVCLHTIWSASWLFTILYAYLICYLCYSLFNNFNKLCAAKIDPNGTYQGDIEKDRLHHQKLCVLVQIADDFFSLAAGGIYCFSSAAALLTLYLMVADKDIQGDIIYLSLHFIWITMDVFSLGLMALGGAIVNNEVY